MDDRKGKGIMEHGSNDSPSQRARQARERRTAIRATARAAVAPYAREDGNPNPGHNSPPPLPRLNHQPSGEQLLRHEELLQEYMEGQAAASRPAGDRGGATTGGLSAADQIGLPRLPQPPPQAQPVPRADDLKQPVSIPERRWKPPRPPQHPEPPPPVGTSTQQQRRRQQELLRQMAEVSADICPVGERGAAAGTLSSIRIELPVGLQEPPQAHPVPRYKNPIAPGRGPALEDGWCPACRHFPARRLLLPREHDCVCSTCCYVDRIVCPVCSSA